MKTISLDKKQKMKNGQRVNAMRHFSLLLLLLLFSFAVTSCSKSDEMPTASQSESTTFTLAVDAAETRATSTVTPARYIMEVWSEDGLTAENVFGTGDAATNHTEITANSITVTLDKTKAYTCLFWADYDTDNTAGTFNAASLKAISLNTGKDVAEAYHASIAVAKGKNLKVMVTLKRAVAKITLTETATVKVADDIALKLSNIYPTFSVLDGEASGTATEWIKTIKPAATTGIIGTFYFFAKADKELSTLKFTYTTAAEKTVNNIPVQQNYATNIKGEYSAYNSFVFTITADDEWKTPDSDIDFHRYQVGDIYFNGTTPIGVVFWVDDKDASYDAINKASAKGKILGLDELQSTLWSTMIVTIGATSKTDGAANTDKVLAHSSSYSADSYPAFAWCNAKNTPAVAGIKWYIPAVEEILYGFGDCYELLNKVLTNIPGAVLLSFKDYSGRYWSSTEYSDSDAYKSSFPPYGYTNGGKTSTEHFRVVSAF